MARPCKKRRVKGCINTRIFGPNHALSDEVLVLKRDAFEAFKAIDYDNLTQEETASLMGVSRTTVQRLYKTARNSIAQAFVEGLYIRIEAQSDNIINKGECHMTVPSKQKVLIALNNDQVAESMRLTEAFYLITLEGNDITSKELIKPEAGNHIGCKRNVLSLGADVLIVKSMHEHSFLNYQNAGIQVFKAEGNVDEVINHLINDSLDSMEAHLDEAHHCDHDHDEHHRKGRCKDHNHHHHHNHDSHS